MKNNKKVQATRQNKRKDGMLMQTLKENWLRIVITLVILTVVGAIINYLTLPAWTFKSVGFWFFIFAMLVVLAVIVSVIQFASYDLEIAHYFWITAAAVLVVITLVAIFSSPLFYYDNYREKVTIEEGDFYTEVVTVGDKLSIVDVGTAQKLGDRTIAKVKNSTWYEVDNEYNLIIYNGQYYRISPLNYGGLVKYWKAKSSGIPGYVLVNCQNQEATFVECKTPYRYSPSAYFGMDLTRHLRRQYPSLILGKHFFEVDEEGNPYWITAIKDPTVGLWSNKVERRFIITDAVTGKSNIYETAELPEWVDHAFDLEYLTNAVTDYYKFVEGEGFFNTWFGKTGIFDLSYNYKNSTFAGYNSTVTADGEVVFFTAVTPANRTESILGFVQMSPRTGEVKFFSVSGAEEESAQKAAQSLTQNFGYVANYPTVINVHGIPTYFMMLKDEAGLVQRYALVNVANYTIAVEDTSLNGAVTKYLAKVSPEEVPVQETNTKTGVIQNLYEAQIDGYTYYYFTFESDENLYMSSITNSNRQVLLETGMRVTIEYTDSTEVGVLMVTKISF